MRPQLVQKIRSWFKSENGSSTVEFVIFFPFFMMLFLSSFEISIFSFRTVMLERALDITIRDLRLGTLSPHTSEEFKKRMCKELGIFPDCLTEIAIDVRAIPTHNWALPTGKIPCRDRVNNLNPATEFKPGSPTVPTVMRVCMIMNPFFGSTPFVMDMPRDGKGGVVMAAWTTYVAEP